MSNDLAFSSHVCFLQQLYAAPTHDELRELQETENLFKSNLFKLQVGPC